jgi:flagellar protein FlaJ
MNLHPTIDFEGRFPFLLASIVLFIFGVFFGLLLLHDAQTALFLAIFFAIVPLVFQKVVESQIEKEKEEQFIRFCLDLAQLLQTDITLPHALRELEKNDYGVLNNAIKRLSARIDWGIRVEEAFSLFADELENPTISRNIKVLVEIYRSGGDLGKSLEALINSLIEIRRLRRERESAVYENILHAYLVFLFFLGVVVVLDAFLIPFLRTSFGMNLMGFRGKSNLDITQVLFHLAVMQSIFAGLALGKMYDNSYKSGLKHVMTFLLLTVIIFKIILPLIPKNITLISIPNV